MYFPPMSAAVLTETGRLTTTARSVLADDFQGFFDAWNADSGTQPAGVASSVGGFVSTVTGIQVGDVIDTQRRRRDTLPESYLNRTITI